MQRSSESIASLAAALAKAQAELVNPEKSLVGIIEAHGSGGASRSFPKLMAPDFERLARSPWPIASLASSGIRLLSSALACSCSTCAVRVLAKTVANSAQALFTPGQCRAARGLLGWSQQELAKHARVGIVTVHQLEAGISQPRRLR